MAELTLEVVEGPDSGRQIPLRSAVEIGRDPAVDVQLGDSQLSRRHARITPDQHGAIVEDLGSSNGTFVNHNELVGPARVTEGDEILIGTSLLQVLAAQQVANQVSAVRAVPAAFAIPERRPTYVDPAVIDAGAPQARQDSPAAGKGGGAAAGIPELDRLRDARTKTQARLAPLAVLILVALIVAIYFATR